MIENVWRTTAHQSLYLASYILTIYFKNTSLKETTVFYIHIKHIVPNLMNPVTDIVECFPLETGYT